ncbi:MAG: hypothetical protein PVF49_01190 [Anaerolineales bacterium]|jgi:hypothetical protein
MEEALRYIETNQGWFYILLFLVGIYYAQALWSAYHDFRRAIFGLERERAIAKLRRTAAYLAVILAGMVVVFVLSTFLAPAIPVPDSQTPMPTISVLTQSAQESSGELATAIPIEAGIEACDNPNATITSPENGTSIGGVVRIEGAASIEAFAFYKLEYRLTSPEATWLVIAAFTTPVCENGCPESNLLAEWDTGLVEAGDYRLRLVVTDTAGNAPAPCEIQVRIIN